MLAKRAVSIVGTRNATAAGRATAFELGEALAGAGLAVVSGLARGIDGAAHRGVRAGVGDAVGVVGSGVDIPYPRQNAELWQWVAEHGLLISEWPPGTPPEDFRFPLRNRIIATLGDVLVVVESRRAGQPDHRQGGSRSGHHRDGSARLDPAPGCRGHQPADS